MKLEHQVCSLELATFNHPEKWITSRATGVKV